MEQRRLRLGDILDDYCPRERRVTNHAIVAMVDDDVKQTRCTTCDAEHVYKGGREPRRRRKDTTAGLYREVLAGMPDTEPATPAAVIAAPALPLEPEPVSLASEAPVVPQNGNGTPAPAPPMAADTSEPVEEAAAEREDGPIHRRLIRATLPRPEGQKETRAVPDFTIRGNGARHQGHGGFRGDRTRGQGGHGQQARGGRRFPGGHGGPGGRGGRPGFGNGNGNGRPAGGRKRSR